MHQYRLLRDNKESGPFSAADLEVMGLKPYDLIWQEGKSAAWRYPGELDELKSFAPPVEEQPYDRFYKKADSVKQVESQFQPKPVAELSSSQIVKGHIVVTMPASLARERSHPKVVKSEPVFQRQVHMADSHLAGAIPEPLGPPVLASKTLVASRPPSLLIYLVGAASVLLIGSLVVLIVNNQAQNKRLSQLRDIVTQMQQNQVSPTPEPISQQVVHFPVEQQAAINLPPGDSAINVSLAMEPVKAQPKSRFKSEAVNSSNSAQEVIEDSQLITVEKFEKPDIEPTGDKRVAIKRDDVNAKNNLMELVKVNTNDYKIGLLGGINNLKITLLNKSLVSLKKVEVQIDYLGPESRIVKSQTVFFENVGPGEDLLLDVPKSNRGVKVSCSVKKIIS